MTPRSPLRLARILVAIAVAASFLSNPGELSAHPGLRGAVPAANSRLALPPREIRLTFSEGVELAFSHVRLLGPGDVPLALGSPSHPADSAAVLVAPIEGALPPGEYVVAWEAAGSDGHPTRGSFAFTITAPPLPASTVDSSAGEAAAAPSEHHDPEVFPDRPGFGVDSPAFVLVRWLTFLGLLGVIGTVVFVEIVLPSAAIRAPTVATDLRRDARRAAVRVGLGCAGLLGVAAVLRLAAQSYALGATDAGMLGPLLFRTAWGWGWTLQLVATLAAAACLLRVRGAGREVTLVAAVALALSAALSGHPVPAGAIAVAADALHVLGAGAWMGTLLLLLVAGLPSGMRLAAEVRGDALAGLVNAFSRVALVAAGTVVLTGAFAAWVHLGSLELLWQSAYGRTLLLKIAALSVVFAAGAYNQRRLRPALHAGGDDAVQRLRKSATVELAFGAGVLLITAVLVATSPPGPS